MGWSKASRPCLVTRKVRHGTKSYFRKMGKPRLLKPKKPSKKK